MAVSIAEGVFQESFNIFRLYSDGADLVVSLLGLVVVFLTFALPYQLGVVLRCAR